MNPLPRLNLPPYHFRLRTQGDTRQLWDPLRRQWLLLTPEEWVRQHIIRHLIENRGVPPHSIAQEHPVLLGGMAQRADVVVYDKQARACLLVECKAPLVELTEAVWAQAVRYNSIIQAPYVIITNGLRHICCAKSPEIVHYTPCAEWPDLSVFFGID